ncbi:hypothetical protein OAF35_07445 [Verrucomicrobiales bacterium]|nr:hypothetical protein [Verrucomicrobiales bacterium]
MFDEESSIGWDALLSMQETCLWDIGCENEHWGTAPPEPELIGDSLKLRKKELSPDKTDQSIIESGYRAVEEFLLSLKYQSKPHRDWLEEVKLNEERRDTNFASIVEVKKDLLIRAYEALHPVSPLKRDHNFLQFIMIWGDFDPRIMSQLVSDPIRNPKWPNHLAVMGQGVYQEFINQKDFKETNLIVYDEYIGLDPYEPKPEAALDKAVESTTDDYSFTEAVERALGEMPEEPMEEPMEEPYNPKFVEAYPKGHDRYEGSKDRLTVLYKDLPTEFKERLIKKTSQAIEAETLREKKRQEKWNLYLEQEDWVRRNGDRYKEYKQEWEADKKSCQTRLESSQIKVKGCPYIVWALDYLKKKWLENGVPILPTQKIIKEFLLDSEDPRVKYRFHPSDWVGQTPAEKKKKKGNWSQPLRAAKRWVYLSAGVNSPRTSSKSSAHPI